MIIAILFSARCNQIEKDLASGHPYARLLYITPESLFSPKFLKSIKIVVGQKELRRLVVDEAHCISVGQAPSRMLMTRQGRRVGNADQDHVRMWGGGQEWGSSFRPEYRKLGFFRKEFPDIPIMVRIATREQ
jgi:superfamily II DNA helicase RecQ